MGMVSYESSQLERGFSFQCGLKRNSTIVAIIITVLYTIEDLNSWKVASLQVRETFGSPRMDKAVYVRGQGLGFG